MKKISQTARQQNIEKVGLSAWPNLECIAKRETATDSGRLEYVEIDGGFRVPRDRPSSPGMRWHFVAVVTTLAEILKRDGQASSFGVLAAAFLLSGR
jgi:hypothetical protein